jgi:RecG-like helicase
LTSEASAADSSAAGSRASWWDRFTRSRSDEEAAALQQQALAESDGELRAINCCNPGEPVVVRGIVRTLTLTPSDRAPELVVELDDGTGSVRIVWLGRRRIPGIEAGRSMIVRGRLTCHTDHPTIYNPRYELKPMAS